MPHVSQAHSIWKFPSVLLHDIKDVEDLNINNVVGLVISLNANICHRIIFFIAHGMPKEIFVMQGRYNSIGHNSTVDK